MSYLHTKEDLFRQFSARDSGLTSAEAAVRLREHGPNIFGKEKRYEVLKAILANFFNPLNSVLGIICFISYLADQKINALIVFIMIVVSALLAFVQEHRSIRAARKLSEAFKIKTAVLRDGREQEILASEVVPGDVLILRAGDMVPADSLLISIKDLFLNESALTGESLPVEKHAVHEKAEEHCVTVFAGSSVVSGTANALVIATGEQTQFGELAAKLSEAPIETAFDKDVKRFVWLMIRFTIALVTLIFVSNVLIKGKPVEALLFSLAVAVGLTPEMLPVVIAFTLSAGAVAMSRKKVIVKHLNAIQNLGSMDILCSDKTGTLTENRVVLEKHCDVKGKESQDVLSLAYMNSYYQTGLRNLLDEAVLKHESLDLHHFPKIDEIPFDFERRRMSVVIDIDGKHRLITKGAVESIFEHSVQYELDGKVYRLEPGILADLKKEYESLSAEGFRILGIAYKDFQEKKETYSKADEKDMTLKGYLAFLDPPKPDAKEVVNRIEKLGVRFLVLTGDDELVTKKICHTVGLNIGQVINGSTLETMENDRILALIQEEAVFARLSPFQKERIVGLLRQKGHVVGFLGDGINDAPSLRAADIGISVHNAVDVARESADIILLEKNLMVLERGILEGRKISGNVIKYLRMGASSNLGNMISMTAASFFLPFLPMTAVQILLNNLLYDFSQMAIPTDKVDMDYILKPHSWNFEKLKKFMLIFGLLSSVFDFLTFGVMLALKVPEEIFHTGWFIESLATQALVVHVIRSMKIPFIQTRSSNFLLWTSLGTMLIGFSITVLPIGASLGFRPLSALYYGILLFVIAAYLLLVEGAKRIYVKKYGYN